MENYNTPTTAAKLHPTLTSTELLELVSTRHMLSTVVNYFMQVVDTLYQFGALRPVTYTANQEVVDLIGDLTLRLAHLEHHLSNAEELVGRQ